MPGAPGAPGGDNGAPPPPMIDDRDIENWARGLDAWPYGTPRLAYRGDLDKALVFFEKQLRTDPLFNLGYPSAATAWIAADQPSRGVALQRAWDDSLPKPLNAIEDHNLAGVLWRAGHDDEAVEAYTKALDAEFGPLLQDVVLGPLVRYSAGRYDDALKLIDERMKNPLYQMIGMLHRLKGECLDKQGQLRGAQVALQTAVQLEPWDVNG